MCVCVGEGMKGACGERRRDTGVEWRGIRDPVTTQSSDSALRWKTPPFRILTATTANGRRGHPALAQEGGYFLWLPWAGRGGQVSEDVGLWKEGPRLSLVKSGHKNSGRGLWFPLHLLLPFKIWAQLEVSASTETIVDKKRTWSAN